MPPFRDPGICCSLALSDVDRGRASGLWTPSRPLSRERRPMELKEGIPLPIKIHLKPDRKCLTSSSRWLASRKGPVKAGHETAGMVSVKAVYEIAQVKAQDKPSRCRISARSWNIEITFPEERLRAETAAAAAERGSRESVHTLN
uniref:Large ribosomal subunit protein uL11 C-terminal domain-containing protein n=1 Tax=Oncorhynchus mykiss TaxID=8022 RepID=A0A8C7M0K9_ONCMY